MDAVVFVNGKISRQEEARISVFDHGFLYGEGIYETLRTYGREPFLLDRHLARLRRSAELMDLPIPGSDADLTRSVADTLAGHPALDEAYIRILVTRGVGDLSYSLSACSTPTLVIIVKPLVLAPERTFSHGIDVALVGVVEEPSESAQSDDQVEQPAEQRARHAGSLPSWRRRGADAEPGRRAGGVLAVEHLPREEWRRADAAALGGAAARYHPGIVLELMEEAGLAGGEQTLTSADLESADEAFITGTTRQITPVVSIDGRPIRQRRTRTRSRGGCRACSGIALDRIRAATARP